MSERVLIDDDEELIEVEGGVIRETMYRGGVRGEFDRGDRDDAPSGWLYLTEYEAVRHVIDALVDADPHHKFSITELAEAAGVSRKAVHQHIGVLLELDLVRVNDDGRYATYRANPHSDVLDAVRVLSDAVYLAAAGE